MTLEELNQAIGKEIKVTYDAYFDEDRYIVVGIDKDDQVIIRRPRQPDFTVSKSWFTRYDTGRHIEVIN